MKHITLFIAGEDKITFKPSAVINAGRTKRNSCQIESHLKDLYRAGIKISEDIPIFHPKICDRIVTSEQIQVIPDSKTSGEVEFVLLFFNADIYVGVGSDHTDRELERINVRLSKQIYPNVLAPTIWRYSDVKEYWDDIVMRSWVKNDGRMVLYQENKLDILLRPESIINRLKANFIKELEGIILYCGTLPKLDNRLFFNSYFEMELLDVRRKRSIRHFYTVNPINWTE